MKEASIRPPRLAALLARLCVHEVDSDAILGDLHETYVYLYRRVSPATARRWYWGQVLRSVPVFVARSFYWCVVMLKNYLKIAVRTLIKNGKYSTINVVGLAVALACCIVAYLNYDFNYSFDAFHQNADQIYRVNSVKVVNGVEQEWGITPLPMGPAVADDLAGVEAAVRISRTGVVFRYEDKVFNETIVYADEAFFDLFTFPLKSGTPDALRDPSKIILSEQMAVKYFGEEDPIGKQVSLRFGEETVRTFFVGAVAEKIPFNSSIQFGILTRYDNVLAAIGGDLENWGRWGLVTFLKMLVLGILGGLAFLAGYLTWRHAGHQYLLAGVTVAVSLALAAVPLTLAVARTFRSFDVSRDIDG